MAQDTKETKTWPELAIGLYDKLTGRNAEITYEFDDFDLFVPSKAGAKGEVEHAHWKMNGTLHIRTTDDENKGSQGAQNKGNQNKDTQKK